VIRLILWRHGRTDWNHEHRIQGQLDSDLDDVGRAQAAAAAPALAALKPSVIVASDLRRTRDTAAFLATATGLPVALDPRLRERYFGQWEGLTDRECEQRDAALWADVRRGITDRDPTVEPLAEVGARASAALTALADQLGGAGTAVAVTHGGAARAGMCAMLGLPQPLWYTMAALGNCHISDLVWREGRGWMLQAHNLLPTV
jgi:probable phosphoglycerate mutase